MKNMSKFFCNSFKNVYNLTWFDKIIFNRCLKGYIRNYSSSFEKESLSNNSLVVYNEDKYFTSHTNKMNKKNIIKAYEFLQNQDHTYNKDSNIFNILESRILNKNFYHGYEFKESILGIDLNNQFVDVISDINNIDIINNIDGYDSFVNNENLLLYEEFGLNNMYYYKVKFIGIINNLEDKKIYKMIFRWEVFNFDDSGRKKNKFYLSPAFFVYKNMDVNFILRKIKDYLDKYGQKYSGYDKLNLDIFIKEWISYSDFKDFDEILNCIKKLDDEEKKKKENDLVKKSKDKALINKHFDNKLIKNNL